MEQMRLPADPEQIAALDRTENHNYIELSVTIGVKGGNIIPYWLTAFGLFMYARDDVVACFGGLERGGKQTHLHIQAVLRVRKTGPWSTRDTNLLVNQIKAALGVRRNDGSKCYICMKPFVVGQTWELMLGYCTKDVGKPHYDCVNKNCTEAQINRGATMLAVAKLSYEDDKTLLNRGNMFKLAYAFTCVARAATCAPPSYCASDVPRLPQDDGRARHAQVIRRNGDDDGELQEVHL